ncbi:hypothetical protein [Nonomuraea gerenzanensis]|uniref:hypothetical protein n=1 Tax=Nonomuraea gerenzanensis TaxID=93944 RepID=UPI001CD95A36|nr:hypothetical protein [Nonomuraea gerenzanensis]UBU13509.1 hypothetical protein LCN96_00260 [Nonomuraea gerenzanensis]
MPKFQDPSEFAAAIAPVIGAAHVTVHASAARAVAALAETSGVTPGLLSDLRFTLPLRPLTRDHLAVIDRYGDAAARERDLQEHLLQRTLAEDGDGTLRPTDKGLEFVHRLYEVHAATAARVWAAHDLPGLAALVARVLDAAERVPGGALELVAPPYEPEGAERRGQAGLLLFNRLAVLRYHRADAHAAAWQAAGLTAAGIVGLPDGPLRAAIEAETNLRAAAPYRTLTVRERETLYDGLLKLV